MTKPLVKVGPLARVVKRSFLESKERISAISLIHHLTCTQYTNTVDDVTRTFYHDSTKVTMFFGGSIIVLHTCDMMSVDEALLDFCKKLNVIIDVVQGALAHLEDKSVRSPKYSIKRFLNGDEGLSAIYTSMIAVTASESHGITFDIGSCDQKSRIYLGGRSYAIRFFKKLMGFVQMSHDVVWDSYQKHGESIRQFDSRTYNY